MKAKRCAAWAASFTIALVGFVLPASAQPFRATVTLPTDARWGPAHLAAGEYTITTHGASAEGVMYVAGSGGTVIVRASMVENVDPVEHPGGKLEITNVNGAPVVTKLVFGSLGKAFTFTVPDAIAKGNALALPKVVMKSGRK